MTGATGLVGSAMVDALEGVSIVSLTRHGKGGWQEGSPTSSSSASGLLPGVHGHVVNTEHLRDDIVHVAGDVTRPLMGLADKEYGRLADEVDLVLHVAGVSDFTMPKRATDELNVEGTRQVVAFAQRAGVPMYHVSTGYVNSQGTALNGRWGAGVYIDSKRRAEGLLADSGVLAATIRPSIVFSDSENGWSPSFQGLHRIIGMVLESKLPLLPFGPEVRVDFLPRDVVGRVTAELVTSGFRGEYWLTAGGSALPFGRVVELLMEFGERHGLDLQPPRFVDMEMIERLIRPAGGKSVSRRIDLLIALTSHFSTAPELPSSLPDEKKGDLELAFVRAAEFWARRHGVIDSDAEEAA